MSHLHNIEEYTPESISSLLKEERTKLNIIWTISIFAIIMVIILLCVTTKIDELLIYLIYNVKIPS